MRPHATTIPQSKNGRFDPFWRHRSTPVIRYAVAVLLVGAAFLTTVALKDSLHTAYFQTPFFFCAIVLSSWFGGFGSGICSTLLSIVFLKFFFPDPLYNPGFSANELPRFAVFLVTGGFISWLGDRQRRDEVALTHARDNLEEKVHARTLELMKANEKLTAEIAERIRAETERRRAGEALKKTEAELDRVVRVTTMGELTASIAHEVNQPLSGITSNASAGQRFIDRGNVDLRELRELLGDIMSDARRAGDVIHGIQRMIRKGVPKRQRVNLNDLVIKVARMVNPNAMLQSCQLETLLEPNLPEIEADPVQLQQVLLNLIINAFDAMGHTPVNHRKVVVITERNGDGTICASVRDYGVGIPAEALERVFEQFFTTKSKGLGIGLAIVRSIVQSHGGTIVAENADGGGARFYFTLPASARTSVV